VADQAELVFVPLGGLGEIGMNLALYGYGSPRKRTWIVVDFGVSFGGPDLPGIEIVYPDIAFLEQERERIAAIVITHAHEDHYGALVDLWPRLELPLYATPFAAAMLEAKQEGAAGDPIPVNLVKPGDRVTIGPFEVEFVPVAHSIPEPTALAIRTPAGLIVHSGDWKLDQTPLIGAPTDERRFRELGEEGVLALVCDSTNAQREGRSPSEAVVAAGLREVIAEATSRVAITIFASNVARIRSIAEAAAANDRQVVVIGRALARVIDVAGELGLLEGLPGFLDEEAYGYLPRDKVVALITGSQGEARAALARIASGEHRSVVFSPGDTMVFSSRTIPGNERAVNAIINALVDQGVKIVTERDRPVHVSGHPRQDEIAELYRWLRPGTVIPAHGEPAHLSAHAAFARRQGIGNVVEARNGDVVRLAPGRPEKVSEIETGRLYRDGNLIGAADAVGFTERRHLSFAGHVAVSITLGRKGDIVADPEVALAGIPLADASGRRFEDVVLDAVNGALDSIPSGRRRDEEVVREAVYRSVRAAMRDSWGKKPVCSVLVAVL
jgi:ribonuclease J